MTELAADGLPPLRDIINTHGLTAKKNLGQNFLLDLNLTGRIARSAGDLTTGTTIEIGPGPGGLTRALLWHGASALTVIERDSRCLPVLEQISGHYPDRMTVLDADATTIDPASLGPAPRRIVANLPYNIGTELLISWLKQAEAFESFTLMFQKEVAERICAQPNTKAYGRLAVLSQYLCDCSLMFEVNPAAFTPPPKVTSAVVHLRPRDTRKRDVSLKTLERVTAAAFGQRRKMLRASLKGLVPDPVALLEQVGIAPTDRAEAVEVDGFLRLAEALENS
jgi:16S rRNA (adenine1518-N6/adenine1519-N6)-dimethyltransferase